MNGEKEQESPVLTKSERLSFFFAEAHLRFATLLCWCHFLAVPAYLVAVSNKHESADSLLGFFMSLTFVSICNYLVFSFINALSLIINSAKGNK